MNSNRLADPTPGLITTPGVALAASAVATWSALPAGNFCRHNAAVPVACGAAIEVPLSTRQALLAVLDAEKMFSPGAKRSRQGPKFENAELRTALARGAALRVSEVIASLECPEGDLQGVPAAASSRRRAPRTTSGS